MPSRNFIAREEKLMPGIKASRDRLTLSREVNTTGDFQLNSMLICHSENLMALRIVLNLLCLCSVNKAWRMAHLFTTWLAKCFKPAVETYCSEKNISFLNITAHWQCIWSLKTSDRDVQ